MNIQEHAKIIFHPCTSFSSIILMVVVMLPGLVLADTEFNITNPKATYVKMIYPEPSFENPKAIEYHCDQRFDLVQMFEDTQAFPGDITYVNQYDPVIAASGLCGNFASGPGANAVTQYHSWEDLDSFYYNANGTPLQYWSVSVYCAMSDDPINFLLPKQIVLLCLDHHYISKSKRKNRKEPEYRDK